MRVFRGAAFLAVAVLLTKALGSFSWIAYRAVGDVGMFVYHQIYPIYTTLISFAIPGFPLAISKLVAERRAAQDRRGSLQMLRSSLLLLVLLGLICFSLTFFGAPILADLLGHPDLLAMPIRSISYAFLVIPVVAALRGFLQGQETMGPTALSQVFEQGARVATIVLFSGLCIRQLQTESEIAPCAAAGALFGATAGGCVALLVLLLAFGYWWYTTKNKGSSDAKAAELPATSAPSVWPSLVRTTWPICLVSLISPLHMLVEAFGVANLLMWSGIPAAEVAQQQGVFFRTQPLLHIAAAIFGAFTTAALPTVAHIVRRGGSAPHARTEVEGLLRLTWLLGLAASAGLIIVAVPANALLWADQGGTNFLLWVSPTVWLAGLASLAPVLLQAGDNLYDPVRYLFIGLGVRIVAYFLLVPTFQLHGAAVAASLAYAFPAYASVRTLLRHFAIQGTLRRWTLKGFGAIFWMVLASGPVAWWLAQTHWHESTAGALAQILLLISIAVPVFAFACHRSGILTWGEIVRMWRGEKEAKELVP